MHHFSNSIMLFKLNLRISLVLQQTNHPIPVLQETLGAMTRRKKSYVAVFTINEMNENDLNLSMQHKQCLCKQNIRVK